MAWISGNRYLSLAEMQNNAALVQAYGLSQGWSVNAICAIIGNLQSESTINPGIWGDNGAAYGLCQWNPYTKYSQWAGSGWQNNGARQLERISYEADNNLQWGRNIETGEYPPYSLSDFLHDETTDIRTLARYWCFFYENPANAVNESVKRGNNATYWYNFLDWDNPPEPPDPDPPDPGDPEDPGDPGDPGEPDEPIDIFPYWILFKFRGRKGGPII